MKLIVEMDGIPRSDDWQLADIVVFDTINLILLIRQQKRREAEEKRSSERRLERRS